MTVSFNPNSIGIIGASSDPNRLSGLPQKYLQKHGYEGEIYPVNPKHDSIRGIECYATIEEVPETPDLVMVMVPASLVADIVEDCLVAGVDDLIIVSSGFSETGSQKGQEQEDRLQELAIEYNANIVGPNSQGLINFKEKTTACFTPALARDTLETGSVSFVTQSGAFGGALTTLFQDRGIGLNKWISTGNEACQGALEYIDQMAHDSSTEVAVGYLEGFKDPRKLVELKRTNAGIDLPIVAIKVGRSKRGKQAAASHTGKIAGETAIYDGVLREHGVITVNDVDLLGHITETILQMDQDSLPGTNLGILSTSGGAGVYLADLAADLGLQIPSLASETSDRIETYLPDYGSAMNPVDTTAAVLNSADAFGNCLSALFEDQNVDTVLLQITNIDGERAVELAEILCEESSKYDKPVMVCWTGGIDKEDAVEQCAEANIPVFENPARCLETIEALQVYRRSKEPLRAAKGLPARFPDQEETEESAESLTEVESKQLLVEYGVDVPEEMLVSDVASALDAAEMIGYPVVAKLISPDLEHKNRIGGVRLGLKDTEQTETAAVELLNLAVELGIDNAEILIQRQVEFDDELSIGIVNDEDFGPIMMFGRGGVNIETINDVAFRTIPTAPEQAKSMIDDLETVSWEEFTSEQLDGIVDAITAISDLYIDNQWIEEVDVNPIVTTDNGIVAVDALVSGVRSHE